MTGTDYTAVPDDNRAIFRPMPLVAARGEARPLLAERPGDRLQQFQPVVRDEPAAAA